MTHFACTELGWLGEAKLEVMKKGLPVIGKDKSRCLLTVTVQVLESFREFAPPGLDEKETRPRTMQFTISAARHLPKMDMMGLCDPFCIMDFRGEQERTEVAKNTLDATFDSAFTFDVHDVKQEVQSVPFSASTVPLSPATISLLSCETRLSHCSAPVPSTGRQGENIGERPR
jgi:hypothetical protein